MNGLAWMLVDRVFGILNYMPFFFFSEERRKTKAEKGRARRGELMNMSLNMSGRKTQHQIHQFGSVVKEVIDFVLLECHSTCTNKRKTVVS
jgi:hypothetical protein